MKSHIYESSLTNGCTSKDDAETPSLRSCFRACFAKGFHCLALLKSEIFIPSARPRRSCTTRSTKNISAGNFSIPIFLIGDSGSKGSTFPEVSNLHKYPKLASYENTHTHTHTHTYPSFKVLQRNTESHMNGSKRMHVPGNRSESIQKRYCIYHYELMYSSENNSSKTTRVFGKSSSLPPPKKHVHSHRHLSFQFHIVSFGHDAQSV